MKVELEFISNYKGYQIYSLFKNGENRVDRYCTVFNGPLGGPLLGYGFTLKQMKEFISHHVCGEK